MFISELRVPARAPVFCAARVPPVGVDELAEFLVVPRAGTLDRRSPLEESVRRRPLARRELDGVAFAGGLDIHTLLEDLGLEALKSGV